MPEPTPVEVIRENCEVAFMLLSLNATSPEERESRVEMGREVAAALASLEAELATARKVVQGFLTKYAELRPAMDGAFAFQANHGFHYTGPTWEAEVDALTAILSRHSPAEEPPE